MIPQARPILIYGSRVFGRVVRDLASQCGYEFAGFVDDLNTDADILGTFDEVLRTHPASGYTLAIAVGYRHLKERRVIAANARARGYAMPALVHPRAYVRDAASIGIGTFVMATAVVDVGASVGEFSVLWPGANVSHHSIVGANSFVSPNAAICGESTVGDDCFIGAGAVIVDHRSVPAGSFVKAGSVYGRAE